MHLSERMQMSFSIKNIFVIVLTTLAILQSGKCVTDECVGASSLGDTRRTTTEDPGTCGGLCDDYIHEDIWYRLDASNSGARMPESFVEVWHCGTHIPIWLNGAHPTVSNPGPVTIPVCAQLRANGPTCEWRSQISVKRCFDGVEYYVYKLKTTPFCDMAYCAGSGINCGINGSWNDVSKSCTLPPTPPLSADPVLIGPYISETRDMKDDKGNNFKATKFSMNCALSYTQQTIDTGARYDVIFESNGRVVYTETLESTDPPVVKISETLLVGSAGQSVTCKVTSYWTSQFPTRSPYKVSNSFKFDIYFVDENGDRKNDLTVAESTPKKIQVKTSFIITTPWCFNLPEGSLCYPYYTFLLSSESLLVSVCTFRLANDTRTSEDIWISSIPDVSAFRKTGYIYFQTKNENQAQNSIFGSYRSDRILVTITDPTPWVRCDSTGDPHIIPFRQSYQYHVFVTGDFVLLKVPSKNIEVHVKLYQCGSGVTCNCGVIAREGNNVLGINNCGSPMLVQRYLYDETNPGGTISFQGGNHYIITLPSGLYITVTVDGRQIHLNVQGNGVDYMYYEGLCASNRPISKQCPECVCNDECKNAFGASNSLFGYSRSNPPPCINPKPPIVPQCICLNGISPDRMCTMPDNTDLEPSPNSCKSSSTKRKRESSFDSQNHRIYKRSDESLPNIPPWPTKSGITEQDAVAACNSSISRSQAYYLCVTILKVNVTSIIETCALDILLTDNKIVPPTSVATQMEILCKWNIDIVFNGTASSVQQEYVSNVCPNQCSDNGNCTNGRCTCDQGYMSDDCSVKQGQVPEIQNLALAPCDVRSDLSKCRSVVVYATGAASNVTICRFTNGENEISRDISQTVRGPMVICNVPLVPVNLDLMSNETVTNYTVYVSLSNDRNKDDESMKFSNETRFIIYDGLCVSCNESSGCTNKQGTCSNLGRCYENKGSTTCSSSRPAATAAFLLFSYIAFKLIAENYVQPK